MIWNIFLFRNKVNRSIDRSFHCFILLLIRYGDKTPKTFLGRAFGIMWILVGAIMLSLFTALFTNAMQASLDGTRCRDIDGKEVNESTCSIHSCFHHRFPSFFLSLPRVKRPFFSTHYVLFFSASLIYSQFFAEMCKTKYLS